VRFIGPGWRNGRRGGLKSHCPRGRAGSNPAPGTVGYAATRASPLCELTRNFRRVEMRPDILVRKMHVYSARSTNAVDVRAARRPGKKATTLARTSAPTTVSAIEKTGILGAGTALISCANRSHSDRPTTIPSGMPRMTPTTAAALDCQATAAANWPRVKPKVFNRARSRRRRRRDANSVSPRETTAPKASPAPRMTGVVPIERQLTMSAGR
jgi:hypothetical protein